ncbi:MAG TPA: S53 family peptidase [Baekduia sp.]
MHPLRRLSKHTCLLALAIGLCALPAAASASSTSVDYGPISHKGLRSLGPASTSTKLTLQLGFIANQSGIADAAKAASSPTSSTYGKYLSLSSLASRYGASSSKRNAVVNAFKSFGVTATVDATRLRATATMTIGNAQKHFGTKWSVYVTSGGSHVAMPVNTPKLPKGIAGNVDTVAGMRDTLTQGSSSASATVASAAPDAHAAQAGAVFGGTPTRTGSVGPSCMAADYPGALLSTSGLFPNQIVTAYGIAPLQAAGLMGQGIRVAIVGKAPTPANDVSTFRSCFGLQGTALQIHNGGSIQPILESSLDAMTLSTVVPQLASFDLWVQSLSESSDDGDVEGFLKLIAAPVQATTSGKALPDVISVSYGECESTVAPYTASRTLVERELAAEAALGITVVVAAGDTGSSACARGVPASQLTSADMQAQATWPATSPWVLAVGGTNLTLQADNSIASTGPWNDTTYGSPYQKTAGGGGGQSTFVKRPWWQPAQPFANSTYRMVPDVAAFGDESPGYPIVCSNGVKGCTGSGQSIAFVGGTSAATPLVAGMVALWKQQARNQGLPNPGFVPPLLTAMAQKSPQAFVDVAQGGNALFGGSCCAARPGYDLATGWGSPLANAVAGLLAARG